MVLSQEDLRRYVKQRKIVFTPELEEKQFGEASIDLRLGFDFTKLKDLPNTKISVADGLGALGGPGFWDTWKLGEFDPHGHRQTYCLHPGEFVLAMTHESITVPNDLIALVEGRSTYARVGLSMHLTAPWIQPGWSGRIVLEMTNNGTWDIELTPLVDRPCQLTFLRLTKPVPARLAYGTRLTDVYQDQEHPFATRKGHPKGSAKQQPHRSKTRRRR